MQPIKEIILTINLKRTSFEILEELYSNLPKKDKDTEQQVHKK